MAKVSILGAGAWGTAIGILLAQNGHDVLIWSALKSEVELLRNERELKDKLPGAILPDSIEITDNLEESLKGMDLVVFAVASPFVRKTANIARPFVADNQIIVNVAKGIEESTLFTLTDILKEEIPNADIAVLSGPSHAEEVSRGIPTTCVVGADSKKTACFIQDVFMSERFRVYTSPDVIGIELGGSLKNVIALAAGVVDGLGYGDNTKAALMTRGIAEISRLGVAMGGKMETFSGLSGVGDLFVTCTSLHSRNRKAGYLIGKGYTMEEAMKEVNQIVEGVFSAKAALSLAQKFNIEMPIVEQINLVLFENKSAEDAVNDLLLRDKRREYSELIWEK